MYHNYNYNNVPRDFWAYCYLHNSNLPSSSILKADGHLLDKVTKSYAFLRFGMVYIRQSLFSCKVYLQNKLDLSLKGRNIACHKSICIN